MFFKKQAYITKIHKKFLKKIKGGIHMFKRGDIVLVDLGSGIGSEVGKKRPCVVIQNDIGNKHSPTTIVCPISHRPYKGQPTQVVLCDELLKLGSVNGIMMAEQIRTVSFDRIAEEKIGELNTKGLNALENAIMVSLGLTNKKKHKLV